MNKLQSERVWWTQTVDGFFTRGAESRGLRHPGYTGVPPGCPRGCNEDKSLAYLINSRRSLVQRGAFELSWPTSAPPSSFPSPLAPSLSSLPSSLVFRASFTCLSSVRSSSSVHLRASWIESRASFCSDTRASQETRNVLITDSRPFASSRQLSVRCVASLRIATSSAMPTAKVRLTRLLLPDSKEGWVVGVTIQNNF